MQFIGFGSGKDGVIPTSGSYNGSTASCSGSSGSRTLTKSGGSFTATDLVIIHQSRGTGAGQWELNQIESDNGATVTLAFPLTYTYTDGGASKAQIMEIKEWSGGNVTGNFIADTWTGAVRGILPIMVSGTVTVSGAMAANACGFTGASNGGNPGGDQTGRQGESYTAAGETVSTSANGQGGGGGGSGNTGGGGGGGGQVSTGGGGTGNGGVGAGGGAGNCSTDLVTAVFGGGGGSGGKHSGNPSHVMGRGGYGGGFLLIMAKQIIQSGSGAFQANGEVGVNAIPVSGGDSTQGVGGGGGGGGGVILVKCLDLQCGTNKFEVNGGGGGTGRNDTSSVSCNGGAGSGGLLRIEVGRFSGTQSTPAPSQVTGGQAFQGRVSQTF